MLIGVKGRAQWIPSSDGDVRSCSRWVPVPLGEDFLDRGALESFGKPLLWLLSYLPLRTEHWAALLCEMTNRKWTDKPTQGDSNRGNLSWINLPRWRDWAAGLPACQFISHPESHWALSAASIASIFLIYRREWGWKSKYLPLHQSVGSGEAEECTEQFSEPQPLWDNYKEDQRHCRKTNCNKLAKELKTLVVHWSKTGINSWEQISPRLAEGWCNWLWV